MFHNRKQVEGDLIKPTVTCHVEGERVAHKRLPIKEVAENEQRGHVVMLLKVTEYQFSRVLFK